MNSYRAGHASWYGPGLYGNTLGCGGTLTPSTVGVAHKSLPCGTKVTFRYRGRSVTARVIDRGPYIAGREWDLTEALKRKLRFGSTGTVWTTAVAQRVSSSWDSTPAAASAGGSASSPATLTPSSRTGR